MKKKLSLIALVLLANQASADDIRLGIPTYGGTGCPAGTASATLSDDRKSLSILFDAYVVEAGGISGRQLARKSCNVAVPVHVPHGLSVAIFEVDYRGFNAVPIGGYSIFNVEYFMKYPGRNPIPGPRFSKRFSGPVEDDYFLNNTLSLESVTWSPCGQDVILRTNSNVLARSNSSGEDTIATLDSEDVSAGLDFLLQWKTCH